jgi:hypothetical protein
VGRIHCQNPQKGKKVREKIKRWHTDTVHQFSLPYREDAISLLLCFSCYWVSNGEVASCFTGFKICMDIDSLATAKYGNNATKWIQFNWNILQLRGWKGWPQISSPRPLVSVFPLYLNLMFLVLGSYLLISNLSSVPLCLVPGLAGRRKNYLVHIRGIQIAVEENVVICVYRQNFISCNIFNFDIIRPYYHQCIISSFASHHSYHH